jgi:hypothetical protein
MAGYTPARGVLAGRRFSSLGQYRVALARRRGFRSRSEQRRAPVRVRNARELAALSSAEREARRAAFEALALMRREPLSLREAAKQSGVSVDAVLRHAGPALVKERGRFRARPADRMLRVMAVFGVDGVVHLVEIRGSRAASLVSRHWAAIYHYLITGDDTELRQLEGKRVAGITLQTDLDTVEEWLARGELELEEIYDLTT